VPVARLSAGVGVGDDADGLVADVVHDPVAEGLDAPAAQDRFAVPVRISRPCLWTVADVLDGVLEAVDQLRTQPRPRSFDLTHVGSHASSVDTALTVVCPARVTDWHAGLAESRSAIWHEK